MQFFLMGAVPDLGFIVAYGKGIVKRIGGKDPFARDPNSRSALSQAVSVRRGRRGTERGRPGDRFSEIRTLGLRFRKR